MQVDLTLLDTDLAGVITDWGQTFVYAGASYPCLFEDYTKTKTLSSEGGGWDVDLGGVITVRRAALGAVTIPLKAVVTVEETDFRVRTVTTSLDGAAFVLALENI